MKNRQISIKLTCDLEKIYLKELEKHLKEIFGFEVSSSFFKIDLSFAFNKLRNQYLASKIIEKAKEFKGDFQKWLLIVNIDLYALGLNFIFGEANVDDQIAIISIKRLDQKFYNFPEDKELFLKRIKKEATHELGHLFYLNHCQNPKCVMSFSNSIFDVDKKEEKFCQKCQKILQFYLEKK